jgi:hypothetical protein
MELIADAFQRHGLRLYITHIKDNLYARMEKGVIAHEDFIGVCQPLHTGGHVHRLTKVIEAIIVG